MNQQIYLFATVFLSVAVVFLFYQNVKMERRFNREMKTITDNMRDMTQMIALNNDISVSKQPTAASTQAQNNNVDNNDHPHLIINELDSNNNSEVTFGEPEVTPGLVNEMSSLMRDYSEFNEPEIVPEYPSDELQETPLQKSEEKYDSISEELKREIEELEKRDSSSECLDESPVEASDDILEVNLEQNQQVESNVQLDATAEVTAEVTAEELEIETLDDLQEVEGGVEEIVEGTVEGNVEGNVEGTVEELEDDLDLEEIQTFDENALEQLNPSGDYKNMVDDIIATASEAENNNETEESKASWDGSVDITEEGVFVELDNTRKSIDQLSVKELTYLCKMSGLKSKGKKAELVARFRDYSTQKKNTFFLESN